MLPFTTIRVVVAFFVGLVVGASTVALLVILIAPSRRVRAEPPIPRTSKRACCSARIPSRRRPAESTEDHPAPYSASDLAELRRLGSEQRQRRRR
jgi:hypothetical protein